MNMLPAATAAVLALAQGAVAQHPQTWTNPLQGVVDSRIELRVEDGTVRVLQNGKPLGADRLRTSERDGSRHVTVVGEDGRPIASLIVTGAQTPDVVQWYGSGDKKRPSLGVTLRPIDETLAEHLGVEPDEVVAIGSVNEGMAAQKAGVKAHDIIIEIDGETPVTMETVQEVLEQKQVGERVPLRVLRKGGEQVIEVELGAGANEPWTTFYCDAPVVTFEGMADLFGESGKDVRSLLERATNQLQERRSDLESLFSKGDMRAAKDELTKALGSVATDLEKLRDAVGGSAKSWYASPRYPTFFDVRQLEGTLPQASDADARLDKLEERLQRIEKLLEKSLERRRDH